MISDNGDPWLFYRGRPEHLAFNHSILNQNLEIQHSESVDSDDYTTPLSVSGDNGRSSIEENDHTGQSGECQKQSEVISYGVPVRVYEQH